MKCGILMRKKKLVTMIAALALTICSATMGALPVNAAENDDVKVMDFVDKDVFSDGEEALNKYDENATNLEFTESDALEDKNNGIDTYAGISLRLRYAWNYRTYPYSFEEQKWSTNRDIYDTYASTGEADYLNPKFTYTLNNPTGPASYKTAIREGYLQKDGELQLYDHVVSGKNNNVLLMVDSDVLYGIVEKDTLTSVFSSSSDSLIGGTTDSRTIDGRHKTLINVQLKNGEYLIMFTNKTATDNNHYALYTGCPLPMMHTGMFAGTHNGKVSWNGGGLKAEKERICPAITISTPSGVNSDLFALSKVWFEDKSMGGAQDLYVSDVTYYYASPANSSYKILSKSGKTYSDDTPSSCSIAGTYKTKFSVSWSPNLGYVGAYYYANTMMYINYLTPYGLYEGM